MKIFSKFYIFILILVLAGSCTDLVEEPVGYLSPEGYFLKEENVQSAINGCYGSMASSNYYGSGLTTPLQIMSDMVDLGFNFSNYADLNDFSHSTTNTFPLSIWKCSYGIIGIANTALYGVTQIDESQEVKNKLEAESRFVRAFVYYHLVRLFGEIPYIDNADTEISSVTKASVADVYINIIKDLEYAKEHLPMEHPDGDVRTRPSKGSAATVLASVNLTLGNWQEAYEQAKWVIDNAGSLNYALETDFQDLFRAETQDNSKEYIFAVDFLANQTGDNDVNSFTLENDQTIGAFNSVDGADKPWRGWSMLVPSLKVYETWDAKDYRKRVSLTDSIIMRDGTGIVRPYTEFNVTRPHAAKLERFSGEVKSSTAGWRSDMNYIAFRYGEVLLIAAEAGNEIGKTTEAVGYVNQIRARARLGGNVNWGGAGYGSYGPSTSPADVPAGINQDDFRTLVLEERRLELAFEFKRWYDIVRRDMGDQVFGANGLEPQPNFNKTKHYLLPIPQTEIDIHPKLEPQNPGY
ncbi:RagB/SusD family nutrient uptake outer membrane protein [Maribellus luteus]|uniref:RagB/SusD family nutrient uptake outer membrane protein n=1 Tax=Maribellus luteus TaxID=2305463 RepID=A0A399T0P6_9BACT|nr:RagB/SusD family nutrient uptake outer membrane protein [Maribellus luteus]RIJ50000.1 RagB/SusD family nutrient uptake outer membrane protein [Maribellus luteus]